MESSKSSTAKAGGPALEGGHQAKRTEAGKETEKSCKDQQGRQHLDFHPNTDEFYALNPEGWKGTFDRRPSNVESTIQALRSYLGDSIPKQLLRDELGEVLPVSENHFESLPALQAVLWRDLPRLEARANMLDITDADIVTAQSVLAIGDVLLKNYVFVLRNSQSTTCSSPLCAHVHLGLGLAYQPRKVYLEPLIDFTTLVPAMNLNLFHGKVFVFSRETDMYWGLGFNVEGKYIPNDCLSYCVACLQFLWDRRVMAWTFVEKHEDYFNTHQHGALQESQTLSTALDETEEDKQAVQPEDVAWDETYEDGSGQESGSEENESVGSDADTVVGIAGARDTVMLDGANDRKKFRQQPITIWEDQETKGNDQHCETTSDYPYETELLHSLSATSAPLVFLGLSIVQAYNTNSSPCKVNRAEISDSPFPTESCTGPYQATNFDQPGGSSRNSLGPSSDGNSTVSSQQMEGIQFQGTPLPFRTRPLHSALQTPGFDPIASGRPRTATTNVQDVGVQRSEILASAERAASGKTVPEELQSPRAFGRQLQGNHGGNPGQVNKDNGNDSIWGFNRLTTLPKLNPLTPHDPDIPMADQVHHVLGQLERHRQPAKPSLSPGTVAINRIAEITGISVPPRSPPSLEPPPRSAPLQAALTSAKARKQSALDPSAAPFTPIPPIRAITKRTANPLPPFPSAATRICSCRKPARTFHVRLHQCNNGACPVDWWHYACLDKSNKLSARSPKWICGVCKASAFFEARDRPAAARFETPEGMAEVVSAMKMPGFGRGVQDPYGLAGMDAQWHEGQEDEDEEEEYWEEDEDMDDQYDEDEDAEEMDV
ncbi:hypothetical protein BDV95DRAFT_613073 [Massariosphaeria phaeospora]|uniref:Zinc finger PHD-type domain-containing protein n=1 Tax=Massariosphaeria phaeospora TaxID=100035 RepID=A0A7C8I2A1_9PLEO|nr:hypothetical protein BDV95DRAFT_613073 [Massariosphaeria phaeospora]